MTFFFLILISFLTSSISGLIGMGGGVLLLSLMTFFLSPSLIIPIHGSTQLISNGARTFFLLRYVNWKFTIPFIVGAPLGAILVTVWLKETSFTNVPKIMIAVLIFYTVFKPKKLPDLKIPIYAWALVGLISGILSLLVGATGPFLAAFFVRDDLEKQEVVATKACLQLITHILKVPAFIYLSFDYIEYLPLILSLGLAAIIGTKTGVKLLNGIGEKKFKILFKSVLIIAACRILYLVFQSFVAP